MNNFCYANTYKAILNFKNNYHITNKISCKPVYRQACSSQRESWARVHHRKTETLYTINFPTPFPHKFQIRLFFDRAY